MRMIYAGVFSFFLLAGSTVLSSEVPAGDRAEDQFDYILRNYVKGDYFDYASLWKNAADMERLNRFLAWQADADVSGYSREERIAFYINAYNSVNIKAILDHYPVHSPIDIPGYFDKLKFKVAGEELTINQIEYDRLIADNKDMRAHFAVVCADRGCLPLRGVAWNGETLHADLETISRQFVNDERHFKVDLEKREVMISKLFDWYGEKFTRDPERPAGKPELFLLPYIEDKAVRDLLLSGEYTLRYIPWEWTLNEKI